MRDFIKFQWFLLIGCMAIKIAFAEPEAPENSTSPIKVISSGDQSLSLDQQLHNVTPPVPEAKEIQSIPSELEHAEHLNLPESVGSHSNEIKITQLQQELQTAFQKADQAAPQDFLRPNNLVYIYSINRLNRINCYWHKIMS